MTFALLPFAYLAFAQMVFAQVTPDPFYIYEFESVPDPPTYELTWKEYDEDYNYLVSLADKEAGINYVSSKSVWILAIIVITFISMVWFCYCPCICLLIGMILTIMRFKLFMFLICLNF